MDWDWALCGHAGQPDPQRGALRNGTQLNTWNRVHSTRRSIGARHVCKSCVRRNFHNLATSPLRARSVLAILKCIPSQAQTCNNEQSERQRERQWGTRSRERRRRRPPSTTSTTSLPPTIWCSRRC